MARSTNLPEEMWKEIVSHVFDRRDIKILALTCKLSHGVAMEQLYRYISYPPGQGIDSTGVKSLSCLVRTLSCSDFPRLVRRMQLKWTTHPSESASQSALLNLTASSVKELRLSRFHDPREDLTVLPLLPTMPFLRKLEISGFAHEEEHGSAQILKHLPALRHLTINRYRSPHSERLGLFVGSASFLTTLSIYIRNQSKRVSYPHDDQVLPFRLAEALEPLKHRLKDLRLYYLPFTELPVAKGCLLCRVGSLRDFTSMRRLVLPLDRLFCNNKAFATSLDSLCQPIPAVQCLPPSLQELWLQLSINWAIDLDSADNDAWLAYEDGETNEPPPISDNQTLPLFATIRAILEQIHHCLPELRTVVLWGWTPTWNLYIPDAKFKALFKKLMPSEQELQAWKIRLVLSPGHVEPYDIYRYLDDFDEVEKSGDCSSLDD